jgi:CRISPR-associated endonuclease/helicase Cas3
MVASKLPAGIITLAAAHDVGKLSPRFQAKCASWIARNNLFSVARHEDWANCEPDHARVSQWCLQNIFADGRLNGWAAIIGAHHGRIKGRRLGSIHIGPTGGLLWDDARRRLIDELTACFGPLPITPCASDSILWSVAGLVTVANWIGSDERFFLPDGSRNEDDPAGARKAIDSIGWRASRFQSGRGFADLFLACGTPRPLQEVALSLLCEPGLYVIEAQMGSGKTEAALVGVYQLIGTNTQPGSSSPCRRKSPATA